METKDFNFDKFGIGKNDIKNEVEKYSQKENSFPIDVFPQQVQQIINDTNECLKFPIDFIASSMLYAVSVAIGNTHKVEIMNGWSENAVLYLSIVAPAGTNKSHPLSFAIQPIIEKDTETYKQYEQQRQEFEYAVNLSKKEREKLLIEEPTKPVWKKYLLSDFTPEALAELHKFNKRGIGVYADELASWFNNFNRYNKGSEEQFWLSTWNSKPINIDRKTGEPVYIPLPFISVIGTIQNKVLKQLANNRTENGFIDRILFVIPENVKKSYWSEKQLSDDTKANWKNIVSNLLNLEIEFDETLNPKPTILKFSHEAKNLLFAWQKSNADECNNTENDTIKGIYSKLEMYAGRLALILEMLSFACDGSHKEDISINSVNGALKLIEYFKNSAIKVHSIISNTNPLENLPSDKQKLYEALPESFKTEIGLQIALNLGFAERTFKRFITEKEFFKCVSYGIYEKLI